MKEGLLAIFLCFLVIGMVSSPILVIAESGSGSDGDGSGDSSGDDSEDSSDSTDSEPDSTRDDTDETSSDDSDLKDDSSGSDDDKTDEDKDDEDSSGKEGRDRRIIEFETEDGRMVKIERKIEFEDGERKIEIKRKIIDENGNEIEIKIKIEEEDGERKIKIRREINGDEFEARTELEIRELIEGNESVIDAMLSNGSRTRIKIMPDKIHEIARERLKAKNLSVELKEKIHKNIPRVVYNIQTNKNGRFLGIFKLKMKVEGEVDPETGEFIGISKPWWAFLVAGEDSDQTDDDNGDETEEELGIEVKIRNETSEVEIEMDGEETEFVLNTTDEEEIISEIIERTDLTREEIEAVIEFKYEDDESDDNGETDDEEEDNNETETPENDTENNETNDDVNVTNITA